MLSCSVPERKQFFVMSEPAAARHFLSSYTQQYCQSRHMSSATHCRWRSNARQELQLLEQSAQQRPKLCCLLVRTKRTSSTSLALYSFGPGYGIVAPRDGSLIGDIHILVKADFADTQDEIWCPTIDARKVIGKEFRSSRCLRFDIGSAFRSQRTT